jgi:PAS domain S-box-containing protein
MQPLTVLVVEDYEPFRRAVCLSLRRRTEFQVIEASDGLEAVEKARELQPGLVLFDISLPKMNGFDSARQVQKIAPAAKLLFVSQESNSEVIQETFRLGAQGYVQKQHILTDLFPAIDAVLEGQRFLGSGLEIGKAAGFRRAPEKFIEAFEASDLRVDAARREGEERFRLAMNNVASGVYTLDNEGLVTYVNPAAEEMFGWTNAELAGKKMHDVTHYKHPDGTPFPSSDCPGLRILQRGTEIREQEDMFIKKDGSFFPVVFSASPLKKDGKVIGVVVGFRDDTQRRATEAALRESEERFRLVANSAPVMIWMSGVDKFCSYFNQGWLEFTGRTIDFELGNGWAERVHADDLERCLATYTRAFDRREPFQMEYRLLRHDSQYRWIFDQGVPRFAADGSFAGYIGSAIDVTERKLAEETVSTMSQKLIQAQEDERSRLARELHDDVNQRIAFLALTLDGLKQRVPSPDLVKEIVEIRKQVGDLSSDIQALSHRLHSPKLELLGLTKAIASLCKELSERQGVNIDFRTDKVPEMLPHDVSLCLFRILQEALQNALKHSGATRFRVWLRNRVNGLELVVQDTGRGFDPEQAIRGPGLGLTSMRERLKPFGGSLSIESKPQQGTTIYARVPLSVGP